MEDQKNAAVWKAILAVQKKVSVLAKDSENPFYKSSYLSLPELVRQLAPVLADNGLVVSQHPKAEGEVETMVVHAESGEIVQSTIKLPLKDQTPQGAGSAISYARRYALMAIFNIAAEDDDAETTAGRGSNVRPARPTPTRASASAAKAPAANTTYEKALKQIGAMSDKKTLKEWRTKIEASKLYTDKEKEELVNRINAKLGPNA